MSRIQVLAYSNFLQLIRGRYLLKGNFLPLLKIDFTTRLYKTVLGVTTCGLLIYNTRPLGYTASTCTHAQKVLLSNYKTIKAWPLRALSDLFARASGLVAKNRTLGCASCTIFSDLNGSSCE